MPTSPARKRLDARQGLSWLTRLTICVALATAGAARAEVVAPTHANAPSTLVLEVRMNGLPTGLIATFATDAAGRLSSTAEELSEIGFDAAKLPARSGSIALESLAGTSFHYDEAEQTIDIVAPPGLLKATRIDSSLRPARSTLSPTMTGAVLNYTLFATGAVGDRGRVLDLANAAGQFDGRIFGHFGMISVSAIASLPRRGPAKATRLDTSWTYEDPNSLLVYRAGDLITRGLASTRPIRLGGLQFSRSFDLRPDLVTIPVQTLRGTAQAPSTLDVFVNGSQQSSSQIPAGPFEVNAGPASGGAGVTQAIVRDLLGRETRLDLPFYASDALLAPGLLDFAVEAGFARRDYGERSNDYDRRLAASGTVRYGLSANLTLQGHAEAGAGLANLGGGAIFTIRNVALVSLSIAASRAAHRSGANVDLGVESRRGRFAVSVRVVRSFGDYEDLASVTARRMEFNRFDLRAFRPPQKIDQAQISSELWSSRSLLSLSYARISRPGDTLRVGSLSVSQTFRSATVYLRAWQDFGVDRPHGLSIGLSLPLGGRLSTSSEATVEGGRLSGVTEVASRAGDEPGSLSWRARVSRGVADDQLAALSYMTSYGRFEAGVERINGNNSVFAQATGGLAFADGHLFASRRIDNAFAVVDVGAVGVPVLYENRAAGKTNRRGIVFVPNLNAYQANRIAIDTRFLPVDDEVATDTFLVTPRRGAGSVVRVEHVSSTDAALVTFVDAAGAPLSIGAVGHVEGEAAPFVVGYDGQAYIERLRQSNIVTIARPDGGSCRALLAFRPSPGQQVQIGPVRCIVERIAQR